MHETEVDSKYCNRIRTFTEDLISVAEKSTRTLKTQKTRSVKDGKSCHLVPQSGIVKVAFSLKGFGFITNSNTPADDVFFHFTSIIDSDLKLLLEEGKGVGAIVEFLEQKNERGLEASQIKKREKETEP